MKDLKTNSFVAAAVVRTTLVLVSIFFLLSNLDAQELPKNQNQNKDLWQLIKADLTKAQEFKPLEQGYKLQMDIRAYMFEYNLNSLEVIKIGGPVVYKVLYEGDYSITQKEVEEVAERLNCIYEIDQGGQFRIWKL